MAVEGPEGKALGRHAVVIETGATPVAGMEGDHQEGEEVGSRDEGDHPEGEEVGSRDGGLKSSHLQSPG